MAEACLKDRFVASIQADGSPEDTVSAMSAVAGGEVLGLLRGFLQAPDDDGLLGLEEGLRGLLSQLSAAFAALAVAIILRMETFVQGAVASARRSANEGTGLRHQGRRERETRFLSGLAFRFKTPQLARLRP